MEKDFLKEGEQTKMTLRVKETALKIDGEGLVFVARAMTWVRSNVASQSDLSNKNDLFRKRTADQIIADGFSTGCTDTALAFIALARARGIPTKYIEAIDKSWLSGDKKGDIEGHVFAECFVDGEWFKIDPAMLLIHAKKVYPNYEVYGEGLDSWDIGIHSFEELNEKFKNYRRDQS